MTHTSVQVQNTSTLVLAAARSRQVLILVNDSSTTIYISFDGPAQVGRGIRINPAGGNLVLDNHVPPGDVYAIHNASGNRKLLVSYNR